MKKWIVLMMVFVSFMAHAEEKCTVLIHAEAAGKKFAKEFKDLGYRVVNNAHQAQYIAMVKFDRAGNISWGGLFIKENETRKNVYEHKTFAHFRPQVVSSLLSNLRNYFKPCQN